MRETLTLVVTVCMMYVCHAQSKEKAVIEYLGTIYIMPDGCPPPKCDDVSDPECIRTRR